MSYILNVFNNELISTNILKYLIDDKTKVYTLNKIKYNIYLKIIYLKIFSKKNFLIIYLLNIIFQIRTFFIRIIFYKNYIL